MSEWKNVLWEDPEEGQVYDVWLPHGRLIDVIYMGDCRWIKFKNDIEWNELGIIVTHFMLSPKPPED